MNPTTSTAPAAPRQFSVANKALNTANSGTAGQILTLNNAALAITNQAQFPPVPDVPELDSLNTHLATAQGHANTWLNTYSSQVLDTLQGVVTFGELFSNLYTPLHAAAAALGTQSGFEPNQIATLIGLIQALQQQVQVEQGKVQGTLTNMQIYRTGVSADYATFQTDYTTANTALTGKSGKGGLIDQLQQQISADQDALNKDTAMIAGGAVAMVVGIVVVAVGVLGEFETAGASTAIIAAGLVIIGGGAAVTGVGGKNYDDTLSAMSSAMTELTNAQNDVTNLTSLKTSFTNLDGQLMQTQTLLGTIITAWQELNNSLGAVVSDLQNPENYLQTLQKTQPTATPATVSAIVTAELETAFQDWTSSLQNAQTQLANLRSPVVLTITGQPTQANIQAAYTQHLARLAAAA
jgi:hypothetical protein